jgi:hypothetical protein
VSDHNYGAKGRCDIDAALGQAVIKFAAPGQDPWQTGRNRKDMFQNEHNALFGSIRAGNPINNGDYMSKSTLMAIMGRMATYTGQVITWDMAMNSKEDLTPPKYDLKASMPIPPVAQPGVTRFV